MSSEEEKNAAGALLINGVVGPHNLGWHLFVLVYLFVVSQTPPKLTPKATFKRQRAWDSAAAAAFAFRNQ